jgi:ABC-type branched-subunit amino acid transport system ATPase component/ABC-type branched-subunit amino acid transport system permease subunit
MSALDLRQLFDRLPAPARPAVGAAVGLASWGLLHALLPQGMPPGILLVGVVVGSLYGLIAVGIVLVYRANKVVNFAQAEFGSVAAVLAIELVLVWKVNFFLAVLAGLVIAAGMGALVDILVIRRFANAPRLILAVATIGLAQILNGVAILLPLLFSDQASGRFAVPLDGAVLVEPVFFSGNHLAAVVVAILLMGGLGVFLSRSSYGIAIRAAAENGDRANLLGVPTKVLSTIVWSLAALLSAAATMLRVPIVGFASFASVSGAGSSLLLRTLAAAVIGRMQSIPRTLAAAIALGVFQETANWNVPRTTVVDAMLVVIILVSLVLQRDLLSRITETGISTWKAIREVRPVPSELRHLPEVRIPSVLIKAGLLAFALSLPAWASASREQLAGLVLIYAIVALSLLVLTGWAGHISLGQFALVGFGGATTALLYGRHGWSYLLALPVGVLVSAAVAFVIGLPSLRIRGPFLAVTTLGFAVTSHTYFLEDRYFPWFVEERIARPVLWQRLPIREEWQVYYLALAGLLAVIFAVRMLRASHAGRALIAVRDNELAVSSNRLDATRLKLVAFLLSGAIAGFAGGLYVVSQQGVATDAFAPEVSLRLFSMVVIGGLGSLPGAILGAVYVRGAEFFLPPAWSLIASGAGLLLLLLFIPEGLSGIVYRVRDAYLRAVARRRDLVVPSLLADERREDVAPAVRAAASEVAADGTLLSIRGVDVSYGQTQVLFGVDLDVRQGELLALLGTNGAGKSTLLKAISGLNGASRGSIRFDGREIRNDGPNRTARAGIAQVPGGRGVFPTLTVAENLRIASWMFRKDTAYVDTMTKQALDHFPALVKRWDTPAGALSGGEQQMLSLAQAFLAKPKLLMIDELSLGLAPGIVERLVEIVRAIHATGTTVIVVEQSVTTALRLAERAVFMEKGEVRFSGPTSDLLDRPDVLRSVFLEGAAAGVGTVEAAPAVHRDREEILRRPIALEAIELRKRYGGVVAVDGVSLQVHEGQIHGLLGANGAGKTTLFDLLSGFVPSDGGRLLLAGEDVTDLPSHERARRGLTRSFQDARLWSSLTVAESVAVSLGHGAPMTNPIATMFGLPAVERSEREIRRRTEELIEMFSLEAFRDKFISELSTGSRRMVEIATLLAEDPKVLLLDEPSSGIAQRETEALGGVIRRIQESTGCAIVIIEHDMPLLTSAADHVTALELGAVVTTGEVDEVLHHPQVVASYLGGSIEVTPPPARTRRRRTKELVG